ncbi:MAG: TonB-dependent receptor, partial [Caulobacter sp.]|nr:TonB-dependent receptor [Caulobacter sp.]
MRKIIGTLLMCGAASGVLAMASVAVAADEPAAAPTEVDELIVTAQKRSERLQDVPLSITAITESAIEAQGIDSFSDYIARTPGLHLSEDSTQSTFTVRGISASASADTTSATAGIYIDDYPVYDTWFRFASPDVRIFDVERIEVLRGPQGTLYGATSLSGSIRIITAKPDLSGFGAKLEATGATTDDGEASYSLNGALNIPLITDKLGVRAVAFARQDGGWVDNPVRGDSNVNTKTVYGGRLYVAADAGDGWNVLGSLMYQHDKADDQGATYYFPPAGRDSNDMNSRLPTVIESEFVVGTLSVDKELGEANLNVTATWAYNASDNVGDGTPIATAFGLPVLTPFDQPSRSRSKTLEARYTSDAGQPFRYVVGAYFNTRYRTLEQKAEQPLLAPFFGTGKIYDVYANQTATEYAVFGEATWAFAEQWEATAGLRVFKNNYRFNGIVSGLLNSFATPLTPSISHLETETTSATPRFSLSWKPDRNLNLYATISEGYRFGLTNYNSGANGGVPLEYDPDTLWNYELGAKISFLDGRANLNTAVYYMDWQDLQTSFRNTNGQAYITNAGDARSYGIESELLFRPTDAWEI